jgi:xanthine dehydrogenase accessory factor
MSALSDPLAAAAAWIEAGRRVALATVIETWGSSPKPVGSQLAVSETGAFAGSVSGGCVEGAVIGEALAVLSEGRPRVASFGVTDETAWSVGLSCGGAMRVFIDGPADPQLLKRLLGERPVALATEMASGRRALVTAGGSAGDLELAPADLRRVRSALADDASGVIETAAGLVFVHVHGRPWRLVLVGAVHIAQALAPVAAAVGFEVAVVDPRQAFATPERFPGVRLLAEWPAEALGRLGVDSRTAVVTLSHDPRVDDEALAAALGSEAFYVGALGSRRTHAKRIERLGARGLPDDAMSRIQAPVGLALGARTAEEIAVSIVAGLIAAKRGAVAPAPARLPAGAG